MHRPITARSESERWRWRKNNAGRTPLCWCRFSVVDFVDNKIRIYKIYFPSYWLYWFSLPVLSLLWWCCNLLSTHPITMPLTHILVSRSRYVRADTLCVCVCVWHFVIWFSLFRFRINNKTANGDFEPGVRRQADEWKTWTHSCAIHSATAFQKPHTVRVRFHLCVLCASVCVCVRVCVLVINGQQQNCSYRNILPLNLFNMATGHWSSENKRRKSLKRRPFLARHTLTHNMVAFRPCATVSHRVHRNHRR